MCKHVCYKIVKDSNLNSILCNKDKTNCIPLGAAKNKSNTAIRELLGDGNLVDTFSALGIRFDNANLENVVNNNYQDKIDKAKVS